MEEEVARFDRSKDISLFIFFFLKFVCEDGDGNHRLSLYALLCVFVTCN